MRTEHPTHRNTGPKVAIVHDFLTGLGGAERVLRVVAEMFPEAPIYTLLYASERAGEFFRRRDIRPSFLQKFPRFLRRRPRLLLPFYAVAVETFDLRDFDVVISSSGAWSKGIVTRLNTRHLAYLHSPMRYVWDYNERYLRETGERLGLMKRIALSYLRVWDRQAADRPDTLIANSAYTRERIAKYYRREAAVVPPPLLLTPEAFPSSAQASQPSAERPFLVVSRLTKSKRPLLAVEAFRKLDLPLVVVGEGPELPALREAAGPRTRFVGRLDDAALADLYRSARALVFPCEEDFGLAAAEALAFGLPVIAYGEGGVREIVEPGVTGELFPSPTAELLSDGVRRFLIRHGEYDREAMRRRAADFSRARFEAGIRSALAPWFGSATP